MLEGGRMKRLLVLIVVLSLLVLGGTLVSAEGRTRRHRSKFGRKSRTAAIIAGGAGVGALESGNLRRFVRAAGMYAFNVKRSTSLKGRTRTAGTVLSGPHWALEWAVRRR
jgi:hypothetical protein